MYFFDSLSYRNHFFLQAFAMIFNVHICFYTFLSELPKTKKRDKNDTERATHEPLAFSISSLFEIHFLPNPFSSFFRNTKKKKHHTS